MDVRPDVFAGAGMRGIAALFGEIDQIRHLHAVRLGAKASAIDQARTDDDGTAALVAIREDELVQRDPRRTRRRWRERRVFVEHRVGALAAGGRADDARSRCVDERLAASRQRIQQGDDRAFVVGAGGIDDDVGGSRRLRENFRVIQRSQHRLDAAGANRVGLVLRANQAGHLMSGGDEMGRHRSADIARCACAKDFHSATSSVIADEATCPPC